MPVSILATKLYIPHPPPNAVLRPRLAKRLLEGIQRPNTWALVSGPAGFGKTSLLSEFIEQYPQSVAWLALDGADNDPIRFWTHLIAACQTQATGVGETALGLFRSPQPVPEDAVPTILINDLAGRQKNLVLILDDYHTVQNPAIHSAVAFLLEHLPEQFHIIFSTRLDPPWPMARFRSRGQLIEIRAADLRFSTQEAADFLRRTMGLELSIEQAAALESRTEGWIAGLQLAALSMRGQADIPGFIKAFTGSHAYIAEYLAEEVLQQQPPEMQNFLLRTSILERLNAGLCETVSGGQGGQAALAALQRANLFIVSLDDEGRWFRYHSLFADLLQVHLGQSQTPDAIRGMHLRAAGWYEKNGFEIEAVRHALAGGDFELAAGLVEQYTYPLVTRGELTTLIGWINVLPAEVNSRPRFLLAKAWALLFAGNAGQMEVLLQQIESQFGPGSTAPDAAEMQGSAAAIRAFFSLMSGEHERALQLAGQAEKLLPALGSKAGEASPFLYVAHSVLPYTLGIAYRAQGLYDQAAQAFGQEIKMFPADQDILGWTIATIEVAVLRRMQGRLHESEDICHMALQRIADLGVDPSGSLARVDAALSEVLREHNELSEAGQRVSGALERMRTWNMPTDRLAALLCLGRLQVCQGDFAAAQESVRQAKEIRASQPVFMDLSRSLDLLEIRLALAKRDIASAADLMGSLQPGTEQVVFLRDQGLVLLARLQLAQGHPDEALAILEPLSAQAEAGGRYQAWLEASIQQALALETRGERRAALKALKQALAFAKTEGFLRVFLDEGKPMQKLLAALSRTVAGSERDDITRLLEAFPVGQKPGAGPLVASKADPLVEPLTARELEVLQLIATGDSNQTIAEKLVITVSAVKKHTGNIFGKLNVNSRTQAVARARSIELLAKTGDSSEKTGG